MEHISSPSLSGNSLSNPQTTSQGSSNTAKGHFDAIVAGTSEPSGVNSMVIDRSLLDDNVQVFVHLTDPQLMQELLVYAKNVIEAKSTDKVTSSNKESNTSSNGTFEFKVSNYQDLEVLEIGPTKDPIVELPLHLAENKYALILVAIPPDKSSHKGELRLTQRCGNGELSEGYSIMIESNTNREGKILS